VSEGEVVTTRLDPALVAAMDAARGELSRSAWLRQAVFQVTRGYLPPSGCISVKPGTGVCTLERHHEGFHTDSFGNSWAL